LKKTDSLWSRLSSVCSLQSRDRRESVLSDSNKSRLSLVCVFEMRPLICMLIIALPCGLLAQSNGSCASPFEAAASPGREIAMNLRAGDITLVGTDAPFVRVSCVVRGAASDNARDIKISFAADHLTIRGGPDRDVHFRIEIPRSMNLRVRCSAGNLTISDISGDKDIDLNAGNLTIAVGDAGTYRHAEASVLAGNISASAFGVEHDGLFRSFSKDNPAGRYRLRADLLAGNLTLK